MASNLIINTFLVLLLLFILLDNKALARKSLLSRSLQRYVKKKGLKSSIKQAKKSTTGVATTPTATASAQNKEKETNQLILSHLYGGMGLGIPSAENFDYASNINTKIQAAGGYGIPNGIYSYAFDPKTGMPFICDPTKKPPGGVSQVAGATQPPSATKPTTPTATAGTPTATKPATPATAASSPTAAAKSVTSAASVPNPAGTPAITKPAVKTATSASNPASTPAVTKPAITTANPAGAAKSATSAASVPNPAGTPAITKPAIKPMTSTSNPASTPAVTKPAITATKPAGAAKSATSAASVPNPAVTPAITKPAVKPATGASNPASTPAVTKPATPAVAAAVPNPAGAAKPSTPAATASNTVGTATATAAKSKPFHADKPLDDNSETQSTESQNIDQDALTPSGSTGPKLGKGNSNSASDTSDSNTSGGDMEDDVKLSPITYTTVNKIEAKEDNSTINQPEPVQSTTLPLNEKQHGTSIHTNDVSTDDVSVDNTSTDDITINDVTNSDISNDGVGNDIDTDDETPTSASDALNANAAHDTAPQNNSPPGMSQADGSQQQPQKTINGPGLGMTKIITGDKYTVQKRAGVSIKLPEVPPCPDMTNYHWPWNCLDEGKTTVKRECLQRLPQIPYVTTNPNLVMPEYNYNYER